MSKFSDFYHIDGGFAFKSEEFKRTGDVPIVRIGDISEGRIQFEDAVFYEPSEHLQRFLISDGDVLIAMSGATTGKTGTFNRSSGYVSAYLNQRVGRVTAKDGSKVTQALAAAILQLPRFQHYINMESMGGAQPNVSPQEIGDFRLEMPDLRERQKIVEILSDCDTAIEQISSKLARQKRQIASLNRTIFTGLDCGMVALEKISSKITRRNDGNNHPVMTISGANGFLLQSDKYSREMSGQSLERYTLLQKGEFAYNKGNSKSFPQGCIYQLEQETAVVPFVYVSFSLDNGLNTDFYKHLFLSGYLNRQLARLINSGVRNDGLLNINPTDFFTCKVPVPSDEEQRKIADIFENMDALVKNLEKQLTLLKKQKRGLMQQLLTGKLRVQGAA